VAGYTRQSSADIIATAVVRANPINVEYNALRDAFSASTGHKHDGTTAEGAHIPLIADPDALNKVVIDTTNNRVGVFVEVSSAAVEQIRIQDGAIVPVTTNDIDLGTSSLQFKDLHLAGTATIGVLQMANATLTGNLTVNGNTTLGNAASDTVTVTADVASPLLPSADDTFDLGAVGSEWRNLYIDGTANIDALVAGTADINGGTVDGVVIGGASAAAGTFTSLNASGTSTLATVDINAGAIDGTIIGANSAAAITGTTITGTSLIGAVTGDVTGNADTATALETARTIGGVSFNGTANIDLPGVNTAGNQSTSGTAATATALETARTIGGVSFNGTANINLPGVNAAGNQDTSGNAASATVLETARTIAGNSFNGSANITIAATDLSDTNQSLATGDNVQFAQVTTTGNAIIGGDLTVNGTTTTVNSSNLTVADQLIEVAHGRSGSPSGDAGIVIERGSDDNAFIGFDESANKFIVGTGTFTGASTGNLNITTGTLIANLEGNVTGTFTGNADTATALATARTIAGQSFDGTANISIAPTDLTGVNATAAEINVVDGGTSATATTLADADRVVVNDAGTMKQVALTDFETYFETSLDTLSNLTTVGAVNSGSITSGFGAIDNGSSAITTTGTVTFGTLSDGTDNITDIVTSVSGSSTNAQLPSAAAVESRIQAVNGTANNVTGLTATGPEINAVADVSAISIDTSTAIANNDGIAVFDSSASSIGYFDVDLLDTYFSGTTKTLTNKTLTSPVVTGMHLNDSGFTVEGSAADGNETTVTFTNPTADHTITFPNATGNVPVFTAASAAAIADGSNGQVLTTNGSGVLSFATAASGADLYAANESSPSGQPSATGANAIAIGATTKATGANSFAVNVDNTDKGATASYSTAIGHSAFAQAPYSVAIGRIARVGSSGDESIAIGRDAYCTYPKSVAIGYDANAYNGTGGLALGYEAASTAGTYAAAIGPSYSSAYLGFAANIGTNSSSYGAGGSFRSVAIGSGAKASANYALAIGGENSLASGVHAIAMGDNSTASHANAVSIGDSVQSTAANQINLGGTADTVRISETYTLPTSDGSANQVLTTNGSGVVSFADASGGIASVAADTSPQLGGNLDVVTHDIVSTSNRNIDILPNGSGKVNLDGNGSSGGVAVSDGLVSIHTGTGSVAAIRFYCEVNNAHYVELKAPPHSAFSGNLSFALPSADGSNGQFLKTNGSGVLSFAAAGAPLYAANESSPNAQPSALGNNAIAIGNTTKAGTQASHANAIAIGGSDTTSQPVQATNTHAVAIGTSYAGEVTASGDGSMAIGTGATVASSGGALALGRNAAASGGSSVSMGRGSAASALYAAALGYNAVAAGSSSMALVNSRAGSSGAFAAGIDNNTSSYGATGQNSVALGYQSKASGQRAFSIGNLATAVGTNSLAIGARAETTGTSAIAIGHSYGNYGCVAASGGIAIGDGNNADAIFSTALGYRAKAATKGKFAFAVGQFAAQGDAQGGMYILRADTTDATATVLTTNNATAAADNQIVAASDTCITFDGTIVAMQNGAQAFASFRIEGLLVNDGGTTTLANSATTVIDNQSSWTVAMSADNTNNALAITVTGEASHNIRWVANIRTSEVTYA